MKTQEQLMKVKIKYLEDRMTTMEKSIGSINKILGRFQMTENNDPFTGTMEQGEVDNSYNITGKKTYDHELI